MNSPSNDVKANVLANEVGKEMIARLDWMTIEPRVIVDMGCGAGELRVALQSRYPKALLVTLDHSFERLDYAKKTHPVLSSPLCAEVSVLPLQNQCVDLIFANFFLPWQKEIEPILREWRRILHPEGLLMLNVFGPDTLSATFSEVSFSRMDMHVIGDLLLQEGFSDPVLDVDYYTMIYSSKEKLLAESYASGMLDVSSCLPEENRQPEKEGKWHAKYEIIYAHAFKPPAQESKANDGLIRISVSELRQQLKSR